MVYLKKKKEYDLRFGELTNNVKNKIENALQKWTDRQSMQFESFDNVYSAGESLYTSYLCV